VSRWKYRTETVTVDENSVTVRGLTAGERTQFAETSKRVKDAKAAGNVDPGAAMNVPRMVAKFGIVANPPLTDDDLTSMPGDLLDAAVTKILELSGVKAEKKADPAEPEDLPLH
jgi:hypothetical protein